MPFDLMSGRTIVSLADQLTSIGVIPVSMADLEAHKAKQVRLHPPNILATPIPYMTIGGIAGLGVFATALAQGGNLLLSVFFGFVMAGVVTMTSFMFITAFCDLLRIRIRGKARWYEHELYRYGDPDGVPEVVNRIIKHVRRHAPHATLRYGELIQRSELLDPYIMVEMGKERACLGIWEDDRIVAVAKVVD